MNANQTTTVSASLFRESFTKAGKTGLSIHWMPYLDLTDGKVSQLVVQGDVILADRRVKLEINLINVTIDGDLHIRDCTFAKLQLSRLKVNGLLIVERVTIGEMKLGLEHHKEGPIVHGGVLFHDVAI